jgi:uncharacterized membrane protein
MSDLIVLTCDTAEDAGRLQAAMKDLEDRHLLRVDDTALLVKDDEGKVSLVGRPSRGARTGAVVGGAMGLLLSFMFPVVSVVFGAGAGALIGRSFETHVDRQFVTDVQSRLQPGTSALFMLVRQASTQAVVAALRPFEGCVHQTTLSPELEQALRAAAK